MPTQTEYTRWLSTLDDILVHSNSTAVIANVISLRQDILRAKQGDDMVPDELLPPIRRQPGKRVRSRDVPCPTCGAKVGQGCFRLTARGKHGVPTDEPLIDAKSGFAQFHTTRTALAKKAIKASTRAVLRADRIDS